MSLGKRLKIMRHQIEFTQKQLADFLGIKYGTYVSYEKDLRKPSAENIKKIADFYNIRMEVLLNDDFYKDKGLLNIEETVINGKADVLNKINKEELELLNKKEFIDFINVVLDTFPFEFYPYLKATIIESMFFIMNEINNNRFNRFDSNEIQEYFSFLSNVNKIGLSMILNFQKDLLKEEHFIEK